MPEMMRQIALRRWEAGDDDGALFAAEKAAPYFAPKLSSIDFKGTVDNTHRVGGIDAPIPETREEWLERRRRDLGASLALVAPVGTAD